MERGSVFMGNLYRRALEGNRTVFRSREQRISRSVRDGMGRITARLVALRFFPLTVADRKTARGAQKRPCSRLERVVVVEGRDIARARYVCLYFISFKG